MTTGEIPTRYRLRMSSVWRSLDLARHHLSPGYPDPLVGRVRYPRAAAEPLFTRKSAQKSPPKKIKGYVNAPFTWAIERFQRQNPCW
jgi:hypothetical protein